jgi:hypothetical protein
MSELEIIEGEELEKRIVIAAYHEAGHAPDSSLSGHCVHFVSNGI